VRSLNSLQIGRTTRRALLAFPAGRVLKNAGSRVGFAAGILAFVLAGAVSAQHRITGSGDVQAKISYCKDCHGVSAQGFNGYYPIPRLAGQQPEYIENQLRAFTEHRRTNNIMFNVAHSLSPAMINALTAHFASLNPPPIGGAPRQLIATGRKIFEDGMPEVNIAACAACHGPEATGSGVIPRLAGQLYPYVVKTLNNWGRERGQNPTIPDTAAIMSPVAHSLNKSQIEAVAAFVSTLRSPWGTPNTVQ
jgi:cytochrome c553